VIGLLQRVTEARVTVAGETTGSIGPGLVVLLGVERGDAEHEAFEDEAGKMNRSLAEVGGDLLLVPQFTLPADTRKGTRPSFTPAAPPEEGERLFDHAVECARARHPVVETGRFGAHMAVSLVNEGPVTFTLRVAPPAPGAGT
jgi:D-tyrosyl-tRNA(Tyr) deacylase